MFEAHQLTCCILFVSQVAAAGFVSLKKKKRVRYELLMSDFIVALVGGWTEPR